MSWKHDLHKKQKSYIKGVVYVSVTIACVFILCAAIYTAIFQNVTRAKVEDFLRGNLRENINSVQEMTEYAKVLLPQIYYDTSASKLMDYQALGASDYMKSYYQLNRYRLIYEPIQAIYLYNAARQEFFVSSDIYKASEQPAEDFCDQDILLQMERTIQGNVWKPISRKVPVELQEKNGGESEQEVFTFLYSVAPTGQYRDHNAVIVNFSQNMIRDSIALLSEENMEESGIVLIIDEEGGIVFSSSDQFALQEQFGARLDPMGTDFLESAAAESGSVCRMDGKKCYMMKQEIRSLGWTMLSLVPYSYITREGALILWLSICIGAGVVLTGTTASLLLTRKFYREIEEEEKARLAYETQKERALYRRQILENVLLGRSNSVQDIEAAFQDYDIPFSMSGCFRLVIARIDQYSVYQDTVPRNEIEKTKEEILSAGQNAGGIKVEGISLSGAELVWICEGDQRDAAFSQGEILKLWSSFVLDTRSRWGLSLSVIVSDTIENVWSLPYAYRQVSEELFLKRTFSGYGILTLETGIDHSVQAFPEKESGLLLDALKTGDIQSAKEHYRAFVLAVSHADLNYFNLALAQLSNSIDAFIETIQKHYPVVIQSNAFGMNVSREGIEVLEDINKRFYVVFDSIEEAFREKKLHKQREMVNRVCEMVEEQCGDPNFTTKTITDALQISYASINKAFNAYMSISLSNYVLRARLEKAKTLLATTGDPIVEVSQKSGFANHIYFHKVFKKTIGLPPGEFRKQAILSERSMIGTTER